MNAAQESTTSSLPDPNISRRRFLGEVRTTFAAAGATLSCLWAVLQNSPKKKSETEPPPEAPAPESIHIPEIKRKIVGGPFLVQLADEKDCIVHFLDDGFDVQVGSRIFRLCELHAGDVKFSRKCLAALVGSGGVTPQSHSKNFSLDSSIGKGHIDRSDFEYITHALLQSARRGKTQVSVRYRISGIRLPDFLKPADEGSCTLIFEEETLIPDQFAQRPAESSH